MSTTRRVITILGILFALSIIPSAHSLADGQLKQAVNRLSPVSGLDFDVFVQEDEYGPHFISKRPSGGRNSSPIFQDHGSACPISTDEAAGWLGGDPSNWKEQKEGPNSIWVFSSKDPRDIRVPFGAFQYTQNDVAHAGQTIKTAAGTFRCIAVVPPPAQTATLNSCPVGGAQLAQLVGGDPNGWTPKWGSPAWIYSGASAALRAPYVDGGLDTEHGRANPGDIVIVNQATLWCGH